MTTYIVKPSDAWIVPGPPLATERQDLLVSRTLCLKAALDDLDLRHVSNLFAEEIVYESQAIAQPITGRPNLIEFLEAKFKTVRAQPCGSERALLELGTVDLVAAKNYPILICSYAKARMALFAITLDHSDKIARIDILTALPKPEDARVLSVS